MIQELPKIEAIVERLPTSAELPESDDTPVDNEIQNLIPNLLKAVLTVIWGDRQDWFFGVDMGIYDRTRQKSQIAIVPDGFLSLEVSRVKGVHGRSSYVLAEENNIVPIFVLEIVSQSYGGEYDKKMKEYAALGVLYYVIYNPQYWRRDGHAPLEVYRFGKRKYKLQKKNPVWMPEIGLGIGREMGLCEQWEREWLYWYDQEGNRYEIPEEMIERWRLRAQWEAQRAEWERERAEQEAQRAQQERLEKEQERERADRAQADLQALLTRLQARGIDIDNL